ncbi:COX15/CtaA family protein [Rubripirellula lacrimiformis]|nr:COX15/CtaA family protein [Rubripirellula lacrimiformis]
MIPPARWLHRLCVLAVCLVWPLIWVGGLVTTYDAGMAVPDWPATYGYNLFLYPYKTWLLGPFDLFIEHGHRLLGAVVGFVTIGIVMAAFVGEPRRWVRWLCVGLLVMVIAQGGLGGMRVVLGDRTLAMVHGCFGPAFFAVCVIAAVVTSRFWWWPPGGTRTAAGKAGARSGGLDNDGSSNAESSQTAPSQNDPSPNDPSPTDPSPTDPSSADPSLCAAGNSIADWPKIGSGIVGIGFALILISYLQLVLGAQLRHVQPTTRPGIFAMIIMMHVMTAFILWGMTALSWWVLRRRGQGNRCGDLTLSRPAASLVGLVALQIGLGIGTWVVNYGWPSILQWVPGSAEFLLRAKGFADSIIVTAHVATGSLILAVAAMLAIRLCRVRSWQGQTGASLSPAVAAATESEIAPVSAPATASS